MTANPPNVGHESDDGTSYADPFDDEAEAESIQPGAALALPELPAELGPHLDSSARALATNPTEDDLIWYVQAAASEAGGVLDRLRARVGFALWLARWYLDDGAYGRVAAAAAEYVGVDQRTVRRWRDGLAADQGWALPPAAAKRSEARKRGVARKRGNLSSSKNPSPPAETGSGAEPDSLGRDSNGTRSDLPAILTNEDLHRIAHRIQAQPGAVELFGSHLTRASRKLICSATAAPQPAPAGGCEHPKKVSKGWGTLCGVCGARLR